MSRVELQSALRQVPLYGELRIGVEEARPGRLVLRLPHHDHSTDHEGHVHSAAIYAAAELSAAVALATHPQLVDVAPTKKGGDISFLAGATRDVTAHAEIPSELAERIRSDLERDGSASADVSVEVLDGHGTDIAEATVHFGFRWK